MAKFQVYEFDPVIYPIKFWVARDGGKADVKEAFVDEDWEELIVTDELVNSSKALTIEPVRQLKDGECGALVWLHTPSKCDVGTLAHEADHVANAIFKQIGAKVDVENDETHAYLVGFVASAIDCVLKGE